MKIKIKVNDDDYFIKFLSIISNIPPFNKLSPKEIEFYSHLLSVNHKYKNIPFKERNKLIFTYDTKQKIADKMGLKITGIYNLISCLKQNKIIEDNSLIPKYVLGKTNELTFVFEEDE